MREMLPLKMVFQKVSSTKERETRKVFSSGIVTYYCIFKNINNVKLKTRNLDWLKFQ